MPDRRKRSLSEMLRQEASTAIPTQSSAFIQDKSDEESDIGGFRAIPPEVITIAIFCALSYEAVAVRYSLDEEYTCRPKTIGPKNYVYSFGRIGDHRVVIARPHQMGTVKAAQCAATVSQQFPNLRFALMVGIGAGIPNLPNRDIRLGDIAVSIPQDDHPGVIQYDFGKYEQDRFVLKGCLNKPPSILVSADRLLEEDEIMDRSRLRKTLKGITKRPGFAEPGTDDTLYDQSFHHINKGGDCNGCEKSDDKKLVSRALRPPKQPVVHRGLILSGSSVIKNSQDRDRLRRDCNDAICFEMEAAGIMDEIPCLIVRGICDYADTHKQDGWHHFAAAVAAAYCNAVRYKVDSQDVEETSSMSSLIREGMRGISESQSIIQGGVNALGQKINLAGLPIAEGASFNSYVNQHEDICLPGTRTNLLRDLETWVNDVHGKCIFWLNGMAGTGKSTISRTVAKSLQEKQLLGASFFFKRGEGDRGNASKLLSTITRRLVIRIPQLLPIIVQTINENPDITSHSLKEQFEKLLLQPLLLLKQSDNKILTTVIVVDALDECELENDVRLILHLLPQVQRSSAVRLRILLTSRPELPVRLGFKDIVGEYQDLILHDVPKSVIKHDISLFLRHRLSGIRADRALHKDWPGEENFQALVTSSVPSFIFASTVCRIFEDPQWDPVDILAEILTHQDERSKLDGTYLPVLNQLLKEQSEAQKKQLAQEFQQVVGAIIILESPLSVISLSRLIGVRERLINLRLNLLHSVLSVPKDETLPVRLFHPSFREFLLDPETREKTPFWVDEREMHTKLAIQCLTVMGYSLKKNICDLPSYGTQRIEIDSCSLEKHLTPELHYACRYWAHHLVQSKDPVVMLDEALLFLQKHFLHWVEAMSIFGIISEVVGIINLLQRVIKGGNDYRISQFLHDAKRFMLKSQQLGDTPLQLYCSGLLFAPKTSTIRREFKGELPDWIYRLPDVEETWSAELQTLEGHLSPIWTVAVSPDAQLLASGTTDMTVRLWNTTTGTLQHTLEDHSDSIKTVTFSPDSRLLASGSYDKTVKLRDAVTGAVQHTLEGQSPVQTVAFSPDGQLIASGSMDETVKVWDVTTGMLLQNLEGHLDSVLSVAFSPDGQILASGSADMTVKLWSFSTTCTLQQTLGGHSYSVKSVAFTPNGQILASGSSDRTVKLWDTATGVLLQTFEGHSNSVQSVAFSDSQWLASSSTDATIKIWDITIGMVQQTLEGHSDCVRSVVFCNNQLLASGSTDMTIKLWDTAGSSVQQPLHKGHSDWVRALEFSSNSRLLASSSYDNTVKLWESATGILRQTWRVEGIVTDMNFSDDDQYLITNRGNLNIQPGYANNTSSSPPAEVEISILEREWVTLNGENVLWLPPEFRPSCSAVKDSTLALGHLSGRISFIGFHG